ETAATTARTPVSGLFSREAWRMLSGAYECVMANPGNLEALEAMLLGAHYSGIAIEHSMLGATHACANPLTARYGTTHGVAIAALLPHVVRWNSSNRYADLAAELPARLESLGKAGSLPSGVGALGVARTDLESLAEEAAKQWTGRFNPRPFDAAG